MSSFVHVDTQKKEGEVIKQFARLHQLLRNRNREERLEELDITEKNTKLFSPIIQATQESTNRITQYYNPPPQKDGVEKGQTQTMEQLGGLKEEEKPLLFDQGGEKNIDYHKIFFDIPATQVYPKSADLDRNFGIVRIKNQYHFAGKTVHIVDDNTLEVERENLLLKISSPGVWNLIMLAKPPSSMYDSGDLMEYQTILKKIEMYKYIQDSTKSKRDRLLRNNKWTQLIQPLLHEVVNQASLNSPVNISRSTRSKDKKVKTTPQKMPRSTTTGRGIIYSRISPINAKKKQNAKSNVRKFGHGTISKQKRRRKSNIVYLPSDIASLQRQLIYLIGEFQSGNLSLRNKIVAILNNLKERKALTQDEYDFRMNSINQ